MRKALAIAIVAVMAAMPLGSRAAGEEIQRISGEILFPTRYTDGTTGFPGVGRRLWLAAAGTNGTVAYIFAVDAESWGGRFVIDNVSDLTGAADLDIYFYEDFGDIAGDEPPVTTGEFAKVGQDSGKVPEGSRRAIVFTANGVDSTFDYTAFAP